MVGNATNWRKQYHANNNKANIENWNTMLKLSSHSSRGALDAFWPSPFPSGEGQKAASAGATDRGVLGGVQPPLELGGSGGNFPPVDRLEHSSNAYGA